MARVFGHMPPMGARVYRNVTGILCSSRVDDGPFLSPKRSSIIPGPPQKVDRGMKRGTVTGPKRTERRGRCDQTVEGRGGVNEMITISRPQKGAPRDNDVCSSERRNHGSIW